jgi:hypothetical protein
MNEETVSHEIALLQKAIVELGAVNAAGQHSVPFGVLYDKTQDVFEALAGTLKAAKKRGIVAYEAPLLLKGAHDKVAIVLLIKAD